MFSWQKVEPQESPIQIPQLHVKGLIRRAKGKFVHLQVAKACNMAKPEVKQVRTCTSPTGFSDSLGTFNSARPWTDTASYRKKNKHLLRWYIEQSRWTQRQGLQPASRMNQKERLRIFRTFSFFKFFIVYTITIVLTFTPFAPSPFCLCPCFPFWR